MIFCSKNEKGEPAWELIVNGQKTVTRRLKPVEVGKILSVQPNRAKKAVGYIKVISCIPHREWLQSVGISADLNYWSPLYIKEANNEGFHTWMGVMDWLDEHKININDTYRIEFHYIGDIK